MAHGGDLAGAPPRVRIRPARDRPLPRRGRIFVRRHRWLIAGSGALVALLIVAYLVGFAIAEPLRKIAERRMNDALVGYSVKIGKLRLNLFDLGADLLDVVVTQDAHPDPPVARMRRFGMSIQWSALLSAKVVGDVVLDEPHLFLDLTQVQSEASDPHKLHEHGWQDAVERIYPLEINALEVRRGDVTYDDGSAVAPIHATDVHLLAQNIRNVSSRAGTYPSPLRFDAVVFDSGKAHFDGAADFLAKPEAALRGDFSISSLPLKPVTPIARRYAVQLTGGELSLAGKIEYAKKTHKLDLSKVAIDGVKADLLHEGRAAERVKKVAKQAARSVGAPKAAPPMVVQIDQLRLSHGELGYVDREADPSYRLFVANLDVHVSGFSNQKKSAPGKAHVEGAFMGSGSLLLDTTFQPAASRAAFTSKLAIEDTDMVAMNDLLRARGGFDVVSGRFSLYSEVEVRDGRVEGYVKPLFKDLDVYDRRQDADKSLFRQAYEGIVGGIGSLLENRSLDEVATRTDLSGRIDQPETSTLEIVLGLLQNAFVRAILPGLEQQAGHR